MRLLSLVLLSAAAACASPDASADAATAGGGAPGAPADTAFGSGAAPGADVASADAPTAAPDTAGVDALAADPGASDAPTAGGPTDTTPDAAPTDATPDTAPEDTADAPPAEDAGTPDTAQAPDAAAPCPAGVTCVDSLPFTTSGDTSALASGSLDAYSCAPETDESGPEAVYRVNLPQAGFLSAAVTDSDGTDVDVHILTDLDPQSCIARGHHHALAQLAPGTYYVVVDTWADEGVPLAGPYSLDIGFIAPSEGPCEMETGIMKRVGDGGDHLAMPATGPVVLEAHLVTADEPPPYPSTPTEELAEHYALSQAVSGVVMHRSQAWAPLEGGSFYGAGIGDPSVFPAADEAFYVCMYWTKESRPPKGTRMILRLPDSDQAVVVAAGYETGPGDLAKIGGTTEEAHFFLGTTHGSTLTLGIATDQTLPLGPRVCQ